MNVKLIEHGLLIRINDLTNYLDNLQELDRLNPGDIRIANDLAQTRDLIEMAKEELEEIK